ncbi:MAG TPA: hypothetical protein VKW06_00520 [Candidatus Angelobacter sp.]|nr:hypothetical protein [Candidatus Angelobacter sp.]
MISRIFAPRGALSILLCVAVTAAIPFTTGCSYSQAQITSAVQKVENGLKTTKALLPSANVILADLQVVQPDVAEYLAPILANAGPAIDKVIAACDAYLANPGADAYQAILNGVDAITAQADQAALKIAGVKNQASQNKAATYIALVSTGLHVALGILENYATKKQVQAVKAASARVPFEQVKPLLNRDYARNELADLGYSPAEVDYAMERAGL